MNNDEHQQDYKDAVNARIGADRMALRLACIPDKIRGDLEYIKTLIASGWTLKTDLYELSQRLQKAESILEDFGFRRCDIPACNCGSYHQATPEPEV